MNQTVPNTTDGMDGAQHEFRQFRAPREHGQTFVQPDFGSAAVLLAANQQTLREHGPRWQEMRVDARRQLIQDAIRYTSVYRSTDWVKRDSPIIMAGHQPSLFHPGVWFKNFSLDRIASQLNATAVNLVVDNDVAKSSSIRVPNYDATGRFVVNQSIAYDDFGGGVPYEQTTVQNLERFDRFDAEVTKAGSPFLTNPSINQLWPHARAAINRCGVAGCALAQARHGLESEIGLQTLEIPLGVVCRGRAFADFAVTILAELPRFQNCYNDAADVYRKAHGIRSTAHPVPNLAEQEGWFEAPMWIYGNKSPGRKSAWARLNGDVLEISDLGNRLVKIDTRNHDDAIDQLSAAMTPEFKLRPRALLTTMYSRLVLSDLFLHGIGGGKYDQLGDMIAQSFFGLQSPTFMVMSATVHLPGAAPSDVAQRIRGLKRMIRETRFQGERFRNETSMDVGLIERKIELLQSLPARGARQQWHGEITSVNRKLAASLNAVRANLESQLSVAMRESVSHSISQSREHSFCLFPLDYLVETFDRLLPAGDHDLSND